MRLRRHTHVCVHVRHAQHAHTYVHARARESGATPQTRYLQQHAARRANVAESTKKLQKSLEVSGERCTFASGTKFLSL